MKPRHPLALGLAALTGLSALSASELDRPLQALVETVLAARERFVDPNLPSRREAIEEAIRGYLASFGDPATRYLSPREWQDLESSARGSFRGFGMLVAERDQKFVIERVYPGSASKRAGLMAGDRLVSIAGIRGLPKDLPALKQILRSAGPQGLGLAFLRNRERFRVHLTPGPVELPSVDARMLSGQILYLRIHSFTERTAQEMEEALHHHRRSLAAVLDLRDNSGGVLDAAVDVHGLLAGPANVTWVVDRAGNQEVRRTRRTPLLPFPPAVVLIDEETASASEILAASLQKQGSLLLGESSYGKGTVQEVVPLSDGGAAVLTIARYQTSPGVDLPKEGLSPDLEVLGIRGEEAPFPPVPEEDPVLKRALEIVTGSASD